MATPKPHLEMTVNQNPIGFDDLTTEERVVYLNAAQRLLDKVAGAGSTSESEKPNINASADRGRGCR